MGKTKSSGESVAVRQVEPRADERTPLRLRVTAAVESILRAGHPWLYAESIRRQNRTGETGDLAVVYDRNDRFLAVGLFDPGSAIRVRVLHTGKPRAIDRTFWHQRLEDAVRIRRRLFDELTTGFRLINGESDGLPGLVLDRYDQTLVLKIYTASWLPWLDTVLHAVQAQLASQRIVLRLSRNIQQLPGPHSARHDGQVLLGAPLSGPVNFLETGLSFEADVQRGQKTGFFLDQRENRRRIETLAQGRSVLNAFSFSGGFSVYAARGGARSVLDIDISAHALASVERNFALNRRDTRVSGCRQERLKADAFEWLESSRSVKYGLIILDPPSLARRETERAGAIQAYARLASLGIRHLAPGGILLACSCSAHVSEAEFFGAVRGAATGHMAGYSEIGVAGQPPDHPASFLEAKYLKAICLGFK